MSVGITVYQVKITCKKKFAGVIENIDRFNRKKLNATIAKYIFSVKIIDSTDASSQEEADAWKAEHSDIIGVNVKACIKNAVNNYADSYIYLPNYNPEYNEINACNVRLTAGTDYMLRGNNVYLSIENGIVKFGIL